MKKLHARWGNQVEFVDVLIRQAHPGPDARPYRTFDEKMRDGERYRRDDGISWTILVDDLQGTTHQVYGGLADPTYLIDVDGRVAFYNVWTHAPTLHTAINELLAQNGRGVVFEGFDRTAHVAAAMTDGWRGLERGLPQSFTDLELSAPGSASGAWLGHQLRPVLSPLTLRGEPLPATAKIGLAIGAAALVFLGVRALTRRKERKF